MICDEVRRIVYFFLDGALGETKKQQITGHLNLCPDCSRRADLQRRLRGFVQRRLAPIAAPPHLRSRLERSLRAFRAEWTR